MIQEKDTQKLRTLCTCSSCKNYEICKYAEDFVQSVLAIEQLYDKISSNTGDLLEVQIKCKRYEGPDMCELLVF